MATKKTAHKIGVMQGRLTPSRNRGIQFFPFENWQKEFFAAKKIEFDFIEFIFDKNRFEENPLWTRKGTELVKETLSKANVGVNAISMDYFMRQPLFEENFKKDNLFTAEKIIKSAKFLSVKKIEIPALDNSSIKNKKERRSFVSMIKEIKNIGNEHDVVIGLETDLPPEENLELIHDCGGDIQIVYDTGNSAAAGFDPAEEIRLLGTHLINVHIKDRRRGGASVPLGTGNADFNSIFALLVEQKYYGDITLQATRGPDGKETATVTEQLHFIKKYILTL